MFLSFKLMELAVTEYQHLKLILLIQKEKAGKAGDSGIFNENYEIVATNQFLKSKVNQNSNLCSLLSFGCD